MTGLHMLYFRYMLLRLTIQHNKWKDWMIQIKKTPLSDTPSDDADSRLIHAVTYSENSKLPPGDIYCVISKVSKRFVSKCEYYVPKDGHTSKILQVDRGANGGVAGNDVDVLFKTS
jgi:hypothetical protein